MWNVVNYVHHADQILLDNPTTEKDVVYMVWLQRNRAFDVADRHRCQQLVGLARCARALLAAVGAGCGII